MERRAGREDIQAGKTQQGIPVNHTRDLEVVATVLGGRGSHKPKDGLSDLQVKCAVEVPTQPSFLIPPVDPKPDLRWAATSSQLENISNMYLLLTIYHLGKCLCSLSYYPLDP